MVTLNLTLTMPSKVIWRSTLKFQMGAPIFYPGFRKSMEFHIQIHGRTMGSEARRGHNNVKLVSCSISWVVLRALILAFCWLNAIFISYKYLVRSYNFALYVCFVQIDRYVLAFVFCFAPFANLFNKPSVRFYYHCLFIFKETNSALLRSLLNY